jgi:pimeloyl-ACP methyl ester carboxylesterase
MLGSLVDSYLAKATSYVALKSADRALTTRQVETPSGPVRLQDTGGDRPCVVIVPDGPCVIEHYAPLLELLWPKLRVVCFDMPGFGFSTPRRDYGHTLDQGARVVLGVLDQLGIERATLAFSCANGFYALRAARLWPERIESLFLSQTPSLDAMRAWSDRMIPWPLRVPAVGQMTSWALRKQLAKRWYDMSLPRAVDREPFREPALHALSGGACFSLAGVAQGLAQASQADVSNVTVPCTMLWGASDRTHRATSAQSLHQCVAGARITTFDKVGHFPDLEQPAKFAELLLAQIARVQAAPLLRHDLT